MTAVVFFISATPSAVSSPKIPATCITRCTIHICMIKIKKYPLKVIKCSVLYKSIKRPLLKQLRISCLSYEYQTSVTNIHFISYEYHESLLIWVKIISALKTDASFDVFFPLTALLAWVYRVTTQNLFWGPAVGSDGYRSIFRMVSSPNG